MKISKLLAAIIKRAQELREKSFDKAGAAKAQDELKEGTRTVVDFNEFYNTSLRKAVAVACSEAGEPELADLVYVLLYNSWNDASEWADMVVIK